jgi:hypothetical protein
MLEYHLAFHIWLELILEDALYTFENQGNDLLVEMAEAMDRLRAGE